MFSADSPTVGTSGIATEHNIMENYRLTSRGSIVFGVRRLRPGRGRVRDGAPDPATVADLVRGFHDRFPTLRDVPARQAWCGWVAMTPSMLPVAGEATRNVFYGIACNGHGLSQAPYLGTLLADRIVGDRPHEDLGPLWRERPRFAPSPVLNTPVLRTVWAVDRLADRLGRGGTGSGSGYTTR